MNQVEELINYSTYAVDKRKAISALSDQIMEREAYMYLGSADWKWCAQTEPTYMLSSTAYLYISYGKIISPALHPDQSI